MPKSSKGMTTSKGSLKRAPRTIFIRQLPERDQCDECHAQVEVYYSAEDAVEQASEREILQVYELVKSVRVEQPVPSPKRVVDC